MMKGLCRILLLLLGQSVFTIKAQGLALNRSEDNTNTNWSATWQTSKVFIENKGQFKLPVSDDIKSSVKYAYDEGTTLIYFTSKGIVYSFKEKKKRKDKNEKEEERERKEKVKDIEEYLEKEKEE